MSTASDRPSPSALIVVLTGIVVMTVLALAALLFVLRDGPGSRGGVGIEDVGDVSQGASHRPAPRPGDDDASVARRLRPVGLTNNEAAQLRLADAPGATWSIADQGTISVEVRAGRCLPAVEPSTAGFRTRWELLDAEGRVRAEAITTIEEYDTPEHASTAVQARDADAFRTCHAHAVSEEIEAETGGVVDRTRIVETDGTRSPTTSVALLRTDTSLRADGGRCTVHQDTAWRQHGSIVVTSAYRTCGAPFDPAVEELRDTAMGDRASD